jgi:hypothetical protein
MQRGRLFILGAAMAVPASLYAQPKAAASEIECIYRRAAPGDLEVAWQMNRAPHRPSAAEDAAMDRDAIASQACAAQHGWPRERTVIALTYAMARAGMDAVSRELSSRGIAPNIVDLVAEDIGERGRAALAADNPADGDFGLVAAAMVRNLERTHAPVRSGSPELAEAGRLIARGLHAMMVRDQVLAAFAAR